MNRTITVPDSDSGGSRVGFPQWSHLDDRKVVLNTPRWVHASLIASAVITGGVAAVLYLPWPVALMLISSAVFAGGTWSKWTYERVLSRRIIPWYVLTISVVLLLQFEAWGLGYPAIQQAWVAAGTTGTLFTEAVYISVFSGAGTCLFLLGALGLFFHHPLASYLAWFLFTLAVGQGLLPWLALTSGAWGYVPGMGMSAIAIVVGIAGLHRSTTLAIDLTKEGQ